MIKAFLSHSSKDKGSYVSVVAHWLGRDDIVYDEFSFEEGEKSFDEILKGLDRTSLFVIFISEHALESDWVKKEITEAKYRIDQGDIKKIYPVLIDENIKHNDPRIPGWISDHYNLKPIKRAQVAARRIHHKLRELSWARHPQLEKRQKLFVGRNNSLDLFEERIHDFEKNKPTVIFASGIEGVGRRTFLHKSLLKTNVVDTQVRPSSIYLDRDVSIEDFILKLNDVGLIDLGNLIHSLGDKSIEEKKTIIKTILKAAYDAREVIFVLDDGCLINYKRDVTSWFRELIIDFKEFNYPVMCCASKYRVVFENRPKSDSFYFIEISELNVQERQRLFSQLLDIYNVSLPKDDFLVFSDQLYGLPDQVMFCVDMIRSDGLKKALNNIHMLTQYNTEKASTILQKHESNEKTMEFIRLLAQFEVITTDYIFSIVDEFEYYPVLEELASENICEFLGAEGEVVRLNDVIRDYIKRNRLDVKKEFKDKIDDLVVKYVNDDELAEKDSSEYIFSIKEALKKGMNVNDKFVIPSHYIRCMKDLYYNKGSLEQIINLADIILSKQVTLDQNIVQDIRYYLCLALCRKKDKRLLNEVMQIRGDEHNFLLGFYYRQCGRLSDALARLENVVNAKYVGARAKREIVQVYLQMEDYETAYGYAKNNYEENRSNQFHAQAYFNCLIHSENPQSYLSILQEIIQGLRRIDTEQSHEMADICDSLYIARIENDKYKSFDHIDDVIGKYPHTHYPVLTKCDIAIRFRDAAFLGEAVAVLEKLSKKGHVSTRTFSKYKAYLLALEGKKGMALETIKPEINKYPEPNKIKVHNRINDYVDWFNKNNP